MDEKRRFLEIQELNKNPMNQRALELLNQAKQRQGDPSDSQHWVNLALWAVNNPAVNLDNPDMMEAYLLEISRAQDQKAVYQNLVQATPDDPEDQVSVDQLLGEKKPLEAAAQLLTFLESSLAK